MSKGTKPYTTAQCSSLYVVSPKKVIRWQSLTICFFMLKNQFFKNMEFFNHLTG